jgi:hypothetical protein
VIDFTSLGLLLIITAVKLSVSKTTFNTEGGRHKSYSHYFSEAYFVGQDTPQQITQIQKRKSLVQVKEASSVQAFACSKVNFSGPV